MGCFRWHPFLVEFVIDRCDLSVRKLGVHRLHCIPGSRLCDVIQTATASPHTAAGLLRTHCQTVDGSHGCGYIWTTTCTLSVLDVLLTNRDVLTSEDLGSNDSGLSASGVLQGNVVVAGRGS